MLVPLADITITGSDLVQWGTPPSLVLTLWWMLRRYLFEGMKRLRFLMGVVMIAVKGVQNARPFMDELEKEAMGPLARKVFNAARQFVDRVARLAEEIERRPEGDDHRVKEEMLQVLKELIDSKHHPKLIVPPDPRSETDNAAGT